MSKTNIIYVEGSCYHRLRSVSKLTKWIIIFSKKLFVFKIWNYWIFHDLLWYCHMHTQISPSVANDNYDDFQHVNFIFSHKIISVFWGLFNDKTNLRIRYSTRVVVIMFYLVAKLWLLNTIREIYVFLTSVKRGYLYLLLKKVLGSKKWKGICK
jgi:hypothetical protein